MNLKYVLPIAITALFFVSCDDDSTSDEFNDANGGVAKKLIDRVEYDIEGEDQIITVNYNADNKVTGVTDGTDVATLAYSNDELATVTAEADNPFSIDELYQNPYDAFEEGQVEEYDEAGNPIIVSVIEEDYEFINGEFVETTEKLTATISYDAAPNPFFYTFEAAGLIEVMDRVQLNFSMAPQSSELVKAKALFPINNVSGIIYKNEDNEEIGSLKIDYVYDAENYPTSATITIKTEDGETASETVNYFYK